MYLFLNKISDNHKIIDRIFYLRKIVKLLIFIILLYLKKKIKKIMFIQNLQKNNIQELNFNKFNNSYFFSQTKISFNNAFINYTINYKYNIIKIEYRIEFIDSNKKIIKPSDLTLFHKLHVFCHIELKNNISIISLANIRKNRFYNCIEYMKIKEKIKFGIKIYKRIKNPEIFLINLYDENIINYDYYYKNNIVYEPFLYLKDFFNLKKGINKLMDLYYILPNMNINLYVNTFKIINIT